MTCQVITSQKNLTKCESGEYLCGSTCFKNIRTCHCGGQTFERSDDKICCLTDASSCFKDSDGKLHT